MNVFDFLKIQVFDFFKIFLESVSEGFSLYVNYQAKVAPSFEVRSGGVPSLIRTFASLLRAACGANLYATDRLRAAAEPAGKQPSHNWLIAR